MAYTPIYGSTITNVSVHTHNGGSPVTFSIYLKTSVGGLSIDNVMVYTPMRVPLVTLSKGLHT